MSARSRRRLFRHPPAHIIEPTRAAAVLAALAVMAGLAGCTGSATPPSIASASATATPTPTSGPGGYDSLSQACTAIADDLNPAGAIAEVHNLAAAGDVETLLGSAQMLGLLDPAMGDWAKGADVDLSAYADALSAAREAAMATKDFAEVDRLKTALIEAGVEVRMSKAGVELSPKPEFDVAKLDGLL